MSGSESVTRVLDGRLGPVLTWGVLVLSVLIRRTILRRTIYYLCPYQGP